MKILAVAFAYNEIALISNFVKYYRAQGCDIFVLNNKSNDGTRRWMEANNVRHETLDTGGMFHLKKLQRGLVEEINRSKPDWIVYTGIDIIYSFPWTIRKTIERADRNGFNMIGVQHYNMHNTGETITDPLHKNYFYARKGNRLYMISKFQDPFGFEADSIQIKEKKIFQAKGVLINYGNCKPAIEREDTFKRRKKAWDAGLDRNYGVHYIEGHKRGWVWTKEELIDIREIEDYKYIKKIKL
jgi:hypothetical protein